MFWCRIGAWKVMTTPPILQLKCDVLMQDRCMKGDDHAMRHLSFSWNVVFWCRIGAWKVMTTPSILQVFWCRIGAWKVMITPPILQLKCRVLMRDRCMKGADHATYPSTIIMKWYNISKINVTIFGRSLKMSWSIFCLRALLLWSLSLLSTSPLHNSLYYHCITLWYTCLGEQGTEWWICSF